MKVTVITGTDIKGCTYHIKETFIRNIPGEPEITEFTLPKDSPAFCTGCKRCFMIGEEACPHSARTLPIWRAMLEADLIVFAYPVYVMRAPGHVKTLLDHLGCHWFAHRPDPAMFTKRAVVLTQSIGAPNGAAQKDVVESLNWLGVSDVTTVGFGLMEGVVWNELSEKRRNEIQTKLIRTARAIDPERQGRMSLKVRLMFQMCKMMQQSLLKKGVTSVDVNYWKEQGWIK